MTALTERLSLSAAKHKDKIPAAVHTAPLSIQPFIKAVTATAPSIITTAAKTTIKASIAAFLAQFGITGKPFNVLGISPVLPMHISAIASIIRSIFT